ncbi:hypothetical protein ACP70R_033540 [Stipagrostis hirtigluma subsp. patula]
MADSDRDSDDWILLDSANPADSSDDDRVLALSSGCPTPADSDHSDDDAPLPALPVADDHLDAIYDLEDAEKPPLPPPAQPSRLSGLFHHSLHGPPSYAAFDSVLLWPGRDLVPDPAFSACDEPVAVLASARGLVCLRGADTGLYYVANPATSARLQLPRHRCDHLAHGDPAVVIAFEDPTPCCAAHGGHYHVAVAFPLGDGVCAYESFSSRTWEWTVAREVTAVERVVAASGVGALGCAFWRTTLGYFLCYNPAAGCADLIPAPQEVLQWPQWELGEMNGTLCAVCMDDRVQDVVVIRLHVELYLAGEVSWTLAAHFEGGPLRNRDRVQLLRSQGSCEVVMWDPMTELVVAMDLEGRTTRTVGPLTGLQYYADFIPYISSSTGINSIQAGQDCRIMAAAEEDY